MRAAPTILPLALLMPLFAIASAPAQDVAAYSVVQGAIAEPLTREPGNPGRGRRIVADLAHVSCLICHALPIPEEPDHGAIGPSLAGVGGRYSAGEIRLRLVDPKALNPRSIMPSYYRVGGLQRVQEPYRGKPIYTAQQIEDVVAYLVSLKDK